MLSYLTFRYSIIKKPFKLVIFVLKKMLLGSASKTKDNQ